jgi:hypothetical protein
MEQFISYFLSHPQNTPPEIIGLVLPPLIDVLNKDISPDQKLEIRVGGISMDFEARFLISLAICFIASVIIKWNDISHGSTINLITAFSLVFTESQAVYRLYFKDSWLRGKIQDKLSKPEQPVLEALG